MQNLKPFIFLNVAMTLDGKIATYKGDSNLSNEKDWEIVHNLRNRFDAILVGKNTIFQDDPKLLVKDKFLPLGEKLSHPVRLTVDRNCDIPLKSKFITEKPSVLSIIATSRHVKKEKIKKYLDKGVKIWKSSSEDEVNLKEFFEYLYAQNIQSILVEGGGILIGNLIKDKLIDDFRIFIGPFFSGDNVQAISVLRGIDIPFLKDSPKINFTSANLLGNGVEIKGTFRT